MLSDRNRVPAQGLLQAILDYLAAGGHLEAEITDDPVEVRLTIFDPEFAERLRDLYDDERAS